MTRKKLQIALEFMIVFSFVLIVFTLIFASVAVQRINVQNSQLFSEEQLIALNVSTQINTAMQAGSGYSARLPISTTIGSVQCNLNISKGGAVIVSALVGNQLVQAVSYSSVKNVLSNSSFITTNPSTYRIPVANGTLWIQNSFGTVCVDFSCPVAGSQVTAVSLSAQVAHAANLNGQSGYVSVADSQSIDPASAATVIAWVNIGSTSSSYEFFIDKYYNGPNGYSMFTTSGGSLGFRFYPNAALTIANSIINSGWHQVAMTYANGNLIGYLDGAYLGTASGTYSPSNVPLEIGARIGANTVNGLISNVQIYSAALTPQQVQQLYLSGIPGSPLPGNSIAGWWPLNGNAQDYSGNGNNGNVVGPLIYTAVAQLSAKATNQFGQPVANALVGFTATSGAFNGIGQAATGYTNANGMATAFLNQQGNNAQALVKAVAFNGNSTMQGNLAGWWPLNFGQGGTAADLSGKGNTGTMSYASWSHPNYVANFDGKTGYLETTGGYSAPSSYTLTSWFNSNSGQTQVIIDDSTGVDWRVELQSLNQLEFDCGSHNDVLLTLPFSIKVSTWNMLTLTCQNSGASTNYVAYLNGIMVGNGTASGNILSTSFITVGAEIYGGALYSLFNGTIADVQAYNSILSQSQVMYLYQGGISAPPVTSNGLLGWWPLDGDANDYSGNGNNGVIYGSLNFAGTSSVTSSSNNATSMFTGNFNGASSYVRTGVTGLPLGNSPRSVFAWINLPSTTTSYTVYEYGAAGANVVNEQSVLVVTSSGKLEFESYSGSDFTASSFTLSPNAWYLVGYTYNGNVVTIYCDGLSQGHSSGAQLNTVSTGVAYIGYPNYESGHFFNGIISNVQAYGTAITPQQVQQLYQEGISGIPIAGAGLVGWWPLNGNAQDYSGNGNNGTAYSVNYIVQRVTSPSLLTSLNSYGSDFNGQSSAIGLFPTNLLSTGSFTAMAWVNAADTTTRKFWLSQGGTYFSLESGDNFYAWVAGTSPSISISAPTGSYAANMWYQVAVTYNAQSGNAYLYANGAQKASQTGITGTATTGTDIIGRYGGSANYYFNGIISNVQIYSTALSANQIQQLYQSQMPPSASATVPLGWMP